MRTKKGYSRGSYYSKLLQMHDLTLLRDKGSGRTVVLLCPIDSAEIDLMELANLLEKERRVLLIECQSKKEQPSAVTLELKKLLQEQGVRQFICVAYGEAVAIAQDLILREAKGVRGAVCINGLTRGQESMASRWQGSIERFLPLGLPFRSRVRGIDTQPFLQRIRCPALIVTTSKADGRRQWHANLMAKRIPTAWQVELKGGSSTEDLFNLLQDFQDCPAKAPQKRVATQ